MKSIYFVAVSAALLLFLSCGRNESPDNMKTGIASEKAVEINSGDKTTDQEQMPGFSDSTGTPQQPGEKNKQQPPPQKPAQPDWDKKIIKTASLNEEVRNYDSFYTVMREKVKTLGGYIAQEEQNQSDYKIENTLVIKVPADQFDNALLQLSAGVQKINERKISSQDVTAEVIDTRSRMEAKKQVRLRYMDLLKEAKNMSEILSVQSEINNVQEQIESASGRINYLGHASVFSTINLTYYQVLNVTAKETGEPSFASRLGDSFRIGWTLIVELFVGLTAIWPLFLLGFVVYIFYKKNRKSTVNAKP